MKYLDFFKTNKRCMISLTQNNGNLCLVSQICHIRDGCINEVRIYLCSINCCKRRETELYKSIITLPLPVGGSWIFHLLSKYLSWGITVLLFLGRGRFLTSLENKTEICLCVKWFVIVLFVMLREYASLDNFHEFIPNVVLEFKSRST